MSKKNCNTCGELRPIEGFPKDKRNRSGRGGQCNICRNKKIKEWQEKNYNKVLAASWRWKEKNREHTRQYARDYGREHYAERQAYLRQWHKDNPDKQGMYRRLRDARKRDAPGTHTVAQLQARIDFYGGRCWMCGCDWYALSIEDQTIDHIKPISKGGSEWPANLRPACRSCNSSKNASWPL